MWLALVRHQIPMVASFIPRLNKYLKVFVMKIGGLKITIKDNIDRGLLKEYLNIYCCYGDVSLILLD